MTFLRDHVGISITAAIAAMSLSSPGHAVDIDQLLGRWSSPDLDECAYADDSEGAPLKIEQDAEGTHIGNYGWLCTVQSWTARGDFLVGQARECGQEGGDDPFDQEFTLGLNDKDQLLMSDTDTTAYRRCPAAK